jgi:hypothetical protein
LYGNLSGIATDAITVEKQGNWTIIGKMKVNKQQKKKNVKQNKNK